MKTLIETQEERGSERLETLKFFTGMLLLGLAVTFLWVVFKILDPILLQAFGAILGAWPDPWAMLGTALGSFLPVYVFLFIPSFTFWGAFRLMGVSHEVKTKNRFNRAEKIYIVLSPIAFGGALTLIYWIIGVSDK